MRGPPAGMLAVRVAHVLAMGVMLGGAVLVARRLDAARAYEAWFWAAAGVSVATGVGNLAETGGAGGVVLTAKLAVGLAGLAASAARTALVVRGAAPAWAYWATAAGLAIVVTLAEALAHG